MDKVAFGRKGELFVLGELFKKGWQLSYNDTDILKQIDWILEKNSKRISIQIKTCSDNRLSFSMHTNKPYDFLIVTDLVDIWIVPSFTIEHINSINHKRKELLCNKFELLELDKEQTIKVLMDIGFRPSEIVT